MLGNTNKVPFVENSPLDCFQGLLCRAPQEGGAVVSAPPRNAFAFLTPFTVSDEKDFALCGGRPKGSALWKPATFEKVDETFPCGFAASCVPIVSALKFTAEKRFRNLRHSVKYLSYLTFSSFSLKILSRTSSMGFAPRSPSLQERRESVFSSTSLSPMIKK